MDKWVKMSTPLIPCQSQKKHTKKRINKEIDGFWWDEIFVISLLILRDSEKKKKNLNLCTENPASQRLFNFLQNWGKEEYHFIKYHIVEKNRCGNKTWVHITKSHVGTNICRRIRKDSGVHIFCGLIFTVLYKYNPSPC